MSKNFEEKLRIGKTGEDLVLSWLIRRGWHVLPVYEISNNPGKGPRVFNSAGGIIAPDSIIFRGGDIMWVEVKYKTGFSFHRNSGNYVTGIDIRHYTHYLEISEKSTYKLWIMFLHKGLAAKDSDDTEPGLFGQEITKLRLCENHRSENWGNSGMVYWAKQSLLKIATYDQIINEHVTPF